MAASLTPHEIIASALQLPLAQRKQIVEALQKSLVDELIDHGPEEPGDEVEAAWSARHPESWIPYFHGTRCFKLDRFPYALVYIERGDRIIGLAVAHLKRRQGYWRKRLIDQ